LHILYIDESGDTGQLPAQPGANDQPVFVIGALIVDAADLVTGGKTQQAFELNSPTTVTGQSATHQAPFSVQ
jgi:hypothetical protein